MIWEYKTADLEARELEKGLNAQGKDGWEIVSAFPVSASSVHVRCIMKRPKQDQFPMIGL